MDEFNIADLNPVTVVNPKKEKITTFVDPYKIERVVKKGLSEHFRFSTPYFEEINLAVKSLTQFAGKKGTLQEGKIYIAIMPGNEGTWAKATSRGTKRREYKNTSLARMLDANPELQTVKFLDLEQVAEVDGISYHLIKADATEKYAGKTVPSSLITQPPIEGGVDGLTGNVDSSDSRVGLTADSSPTQEETPVTEQEDNF